MILSQSGKPLKSFPEYSISETPNNKPGTGNPNKKTGDYNDNPTHPTILRKPACPEQVGFLRGGGDLSAVSEYDPRWRETAY
jgi:hypothetical protein